MISVGVPAWFHHHNDGKTLVQHLSWSLIVVFAIFGLVASGMLPSEPGRAVASALCMALMIQSWVMQRRYAKNRERLVLLTLALTLPALASLWLGMNVLRFYSYAPWRRMTGE
jgi:hypothetical protein